MANRRCEKAIYNGAFRAQQCSRSGVVERDGHFWCRQHDPEQRAARQRERMTRLDQEVAARNAIRAEGEALREQLGLGEPQWGVPTIPLSYDEARGLIARIAKAEGK